MKTSEFLKLGKILLNSSLVLVGMVFILLAVYLFGWDLLSGYLVGNDIGIAQMNALWYDRFFPNFPQWFPLHGAGVQLFQGVIGAPIITVLTSRIFSMTIVQSIHLWEFLAVYLTALGIFIFTRIKFKSWIAAILAGIFYPLSNASWAWLTEIGTYAQAIAFIFYPFALLTLDLFLSELFGEKKERRMILWFVLSSLFVSFTILTHVLAGAVLIATVVIYGTTFSLVTQGKRLKNLLFSLTPLFLIILTAILLSGFWFFPYLRYNAIASRNILPTWSFEQLPYTSLSALLGLSSFEDLPNLQINGMWYVFFSRPVWILALVGIIFAFFKKKRVAIAAAIISLFFIFYAIAPGTFPWLVKTFLIFWREIFIRGLIPVIIFLPILAAWGCLATGQWLSGLISKNHPKSLVSLFLTLLVAVLALYLFKGGPSNEDQSPCYQGFGRWWRTEVDYCHFWDKLGKVDFRLSELPAPYDFLAKEISGKLNLSPQTRMDISPRHGELIALWSNNSDASILPLYWYATALNWKFLGYQEGVFYDGYTMEPVEAIPELTSWFGVQYILLHKSDDLEMAKKNKTDPVAKYNNDNWEKIFEDQDNSLEVRRFKNINSLVTWTKRPVVLVVGDLKKQAYEQVFRKAVNGILPYSKALLVEGKDDGRLDKYTVEELKKFDGLILYGQLYENKEKTDRLLSDYVQEGGRLFIESGWQFTNSEWQTHQALEVIPLKKFAWEQGPTTNLKIDMGEMGGVFDPEKFGDFIFYEKTWNVATAAREELKDWGSIALERNDKPIVVAGKFGQGRVVWSGMNLMGHLEFYKSREEYGFTRRLFDWLLEGKENKDLNITLERPNPDKIEFTLKETNPSYTSLLWRENFFPDWRASLVRTEDGRQKTERLPIYRAGANLMLLRLGPVQRGEKITLEFKLSLIAQIARILSLVTLLSLLVFLSVPKTLLVFVDFGKKFLARFSKAVLEDDEY